MLTRVEAGRVSRIRTFTPDCNLDSGGMPVVWLQNVTPDDSVAWLTTLVPGIAGHRAKAATASARRR